MSCWSWPLPGIGLALARPQWGNRGIGPGNPRRRHRLRPRLLPQHARSDVNPSRLQRAKLAIPDFVRGTRTAVSAWSLSPATPSCNALLLLTIALSKRRSWPWTRKPSPSSEPISASRSKRLSPLWTKQNRHKLLVLVTDGEDLEKGGVRTAEKLAKKASSFNRRRRHTPRPGNRNRQRTGPA